MLEVFAVNFWALSNTNKHWVMYVLQCV